MCKTEVASIIQWIRFHSDMLRTWDTSHWFELRVDQALPKIGLRRVMPGTGMNWTHLSKVTGHDML
jgi:hypothetical protein